MRTVPDSDLDAAVDLGEALARTPALPPRPKSPVLPDYLSPVDDATLALVVGTRQSGERKKNSAAFSYVFARAKRKFSF
jgi:hypothetical protein